jgi:uncharacterized protein YbaP (TraB family)
MTGDADTLAALSRAGMDDEPELLEFYRRMNQERNEKWLETIEGFLRDDKVYLVVVGALHLAGDGSLIELLRARGYSLDQL